MDINDNLDADFRSFGLSSESRDYLVQSARWAKIIAIVTIITVLVGFLGTFLFLGFSGFMFGRMQTSPLGFLLVLYVIMILVFGFIGLLPFYWLYKFSTETKGNLVDYKGVPLSTGINHLKSFFKTIVIFSLIVIVLYAILFLFALIA